MDDSSSRGSSRNSNVRSRKKRKGKPLTLWQEIESSLGLHGVRRIKPGKRTIFFSLLWCVILAAGLAFFCFEMVQSIQAYLTYPTGWQLAFEHPQWPGITICNLNPVRVTQLAKNYWRSANKQRHQFSWSQFLDERPYVDSMDFFVTNKHSAEDMIIKCSAGSIPCSSSNFSLTPTEDGVCYKLRPDFKTSKLELVLNSESYEYIEGLPHSTGFKIFVHNLEESPVRQDTHVYVFPGYNFELEIGRETYTSLPRPYSDCISSTLDTRTCLAHCFVEKIKTFCDCRAFWFPDDGNAECDIKTHFQCVKETLDTHARSCRCENDCEYSFFTTHMEMYPKVTHSLTSIFDHHQMQSIAQGFEAARDIQASISNELQEVDNTVINRFLSAYEHAVSLLEQSERELFEVKSICEREFRDLDSRIHFHQNVALGGIQKIIQQGYTDIWNVLENRDLARITNSYQEVIGQFDRIVTRLRFSSVVEFDMSKMLYTLVDMDLSVNLDLAAETLDNVTSLFYAYTRAEPLGDLEITPNKRYDEYLIPRSILMLDIEQQQQHYSGISNNLRLYIEAILQLKNVLKDAMINKRHNETAYLLAKEAFIKHSSNIVHTKEIFRENFVARTENTINSKLQFVQHLSVSLSHNIALFQKKIVSMENYLSSVHLEVFQDMKRLANMSSTYLHHSGVSNTELAISFLDRYLRTHLHSIQATSFELRQQFRELSLIINSLQQSVIAVWEILFGEELLGNFYVNLSNDVLDMMTNTKRTTQLLQIFTDPKMLNLSMANQSEIILERFLVLLNADIARKEYDTVVGFVNSAFQNVQNILKKHGGLINALSDLHTVLDDTCDFFNQTDKEKQLGSNFAKDNLLVVQISLNPSDYIHWTQHMTYTVTALIAQIGAQLAFMMGASMLTLLEICDILLAWCGDKFCSEGRQATKEIPAEYRDKIKSRESLGSRDIDLNSSLNSQRRSYVTFRDFNHVNGSEV